MTETVSFLTPPSEEAVDEIIAAFVEALDAGATPDHAEWLRRYPQAAEALRAFFTDQASFQERVAPLQACLSGVLKEVGAGDLPVLGLRVGDYELLEEVARGGMGVVFKARHVHLGRIVALKMIRSGALASAAEVQRFRQEAEAVAQLDHPNIVPIYEVGEHERQPYFAMKLIHGGSLAQLISPQRSQGETTREIADQELLSAASCSAVSAATLVVAVARAVHHAHQRGILHRDLKPANILLETPEPATGFTTPYVTDFGLAKHLTSVRERLTQPGLAVGTPSYMAPEQATPTEPGITIAVDVYSLGAILYELLTGQPPFEGETPLETLRQARDQEAVPPRQLRPDIPRDMDVICRKCLEKEPGRRYASAEALAQELERWLRGEPIMARPVSAPERAWRWCQRQPALAATSAAAILGLLAVTVVSIWFALSEAAGRRELDRALIEANTLRQLALVRLSQANEALQARDRALGEANHQRERAEKNLQQTQEVIEDFYVRFREQGLSRVPGLQKLEKEFMEKALAHFQQIRTQKSDNSRQRFDVARAAIRVGDITLHLGDRTGALPYYHEAVTLLDELEKTDSTRGYLYRSWLAVAHANRGIVEKNLGREQDALLSYERAAQLCARLEKERPDRGQVRRNRALNLLNLAGLHHNLGHNEEALRQCRLANQLLDELCVEVMHRRFASAEEARQEKVRTETDLARARYSLGRQLYLAGQGQESVTPLEEARKLQEGLLQHNPGNQELRKELAETYQNLGRQLGRSPGRSAEAAQFLKKAEDILAELSAANPNVPVFQVLQAMSSRQRGNSLLRTGQKEEGQRLLRQAIAHLEQLSGRFPESRAQQVELASAKHDLAQFLLDQRQPAAALSLFEAARELRQKILEASPTNLEARHELSHTLGRLGQCLTALERGAEGCVALQQALQQDATCLKNAPQTGSFRKLFREHVERLVQIQHGLKRTGETEQTWVAARKQLEVVQKTNPHLSDLQLEVALCLQEWARDRRDHGQPEQALPLFKEAIALLEPLAERRPTGYLPYLAHLQFQMALGQAAVKNLQGELKHYAQASDLQRRVLELHHNQPGQLIQARSSLGVYLNNQGLTLARANQLKEGEAALREAIEQQALALKGAPTHTGIRRLLLGHQRALADVLVKANHFSAAATVYLELQRLAGKNSAELVQVAREFGRLAGLVARGKKEVSSAEQAERDRLADLALDALRQARAAGYRPGPELKQDPALALVRQRPGWKELVEMK